MESSYISGLWKGRIDATSDGSSFYDAGSVTYLGRANGVTLEAMGLLPVGPVALYAKGGWAWWRMKSTFDNNASSVPFSDDGDTWLVGAGVNMRRGRISRCVENGSGFTAWKSSIPTCSGQASPSGSSDCHFDRREKSLALFGGKIMVDPIVKTVF